MQLRSDSAVAERAGSVSAPIYQRLERETEMIMSHVTCDGNITFRPLGALDFATSMPFRHLVHDALAPDLTIVLDMSQVSLIDGVGLSAIVGFVRRAWLLGATIRIRNPRLTIRHQMRLVGLDGFIDVQSSAENNGDDAA